MALAMRHHPLHEFLLFFLQLQELGAKLGMSPDEMAAKLSQYLPNAIDKLTPRGNV